jgi:hypothetical protein
MLQTQGQLKVAPDGNYVIGTYDGVRVFTPQGTFVRQYGAGRATGITFVPGNRLWATDVVATTVSIFNTDTGAQVASFTADGQLYAGVMSYSPFTNTVLMVVGDRDAGGAYERDLAGNLLHEFHVPHRQTYLNGAVRTPNGDVYGTHDLYSPSYPDLVHWSAGGSVLDDRAIWPVQIVPGEILWAGSVPEPASTILAICSSICLLKRTRSHVGF